jgi:ABC transport system ATP-binding/permease protein
MKLIIEDEEGRRTTVSLVRDEISIGRQEGNTVLLPDRNVSRRHALLIRQNGHVLIEDLNSFNGVRVNGERISGRTAVREGDLVQIGDFDLTLGRDSGIEVSDGRAQTQPEHLARDTVPLPAVTAPGKDTDPQRKPSGTVVIQPPVLPPSTPDVLRPIERPRLVLLNTPEVGREIIIDRSAVTIGRGPEESDLVVEHPSLGRGHARVRRDAEGAWRLTALGMAGGVKVNGVRHTETTLAPGDILQLGLVRMRFVSPGERFSLAGWREEQRRQERPYQFLLGILALLFVGLLVYVIVNRPKEAVVAPQATPATASARHEDEIDPAKPAAHEVVSPVATPVPSEPPLPADPHAKGTKGHRHRGANDEGTEPGGTPAQGVSIDAQARGAVLYEEGVALIGDADYVGALGKLSLALDLDPKLADAHKAMGVCYAHLQEADKGAYHYEQYLKLNPGAEDAAQVRRMLADYYKTRPPARAE